jgi:hypothetical protein
MKFARIVLIGIAAVVVLLLIASVVAFNSGFQTWAARKALASQPDLKGSIGRVEAGLQHVHVEQVRIVRDGMILTLPSADVDLPVLSAAKKNIAIKRVVAKGWTLELTATTAPVGRVALHPAAAFSLVSTALAADAIPAPAAVFPGVFELLKLPVDLSVDSAELEGEVIFPGAKGQPIHSKVTLTGGQLSVGREGKFAFSAVSTLPPESPVNVLDARGTITVFLETPRTFSRLAAEVDADAHGRQVPAGAKLNLVTTAAKAADGENYTLNVQSADRKLAVVQASYPSAPRAGSARAIGGTWTLDLSDKDVAPFALNFSLPAFTLNGTGKFEADAAFASFSGSGRLDATADRLGAVRPELQAIGPVKIAATFDVAQDGSVIRVGNLVVNLAGEKPIASITGLQSFEFNTKTAELKVADLGKELVKVELTGVPVAWAQSFLKDFALKGEDVRGEFTVTAHDGGFGVRAVSPLTLSNLSAAKAGQPLVAGLTVSAKISADYTPQGWQAEVLDLTARAGDAVLLTLNGKAGQLAEKGQPIKATGRWSADLPAIAAQPAARSAATLRKGRAAGEFAASLGSKKEIQAKLSLSELAADPKLAPDGLPDIAAEVRADVDAEGKTTVNAPLLLTLAGRKSDLTLSGTFAPSTSGLKLDGRLASTQLFATDAQILSAVLGGNSEETSAAGPTPGRDEIPFWNGVTGQVVLALKKVVYGKDFEISDVGGTLRIEAGSLNLEGVRAGLGEGGALRLAGGVTFAGKAKEPYALKADLAVNNFDSGLFFKALEPAKKPTVEGKVDVVSQLSGGGTNVGQLAERTRGEFRLTSKGGIFRALRSDVAEALKAAPSTISGLVSGIGSLLGSAEKGEKLAADINKRGKLVTEIADRLAEIPFDQLSVAVVRDAALNVRLYDFTLISPEVRLGGTGEIRHVDNTPLLGQPLDLRLQLGARGQLADLMNRASLLDGRQDNLGYSGFAFPLRVGGSLQNPDTGELKAALIKAAGGSLLNNLIGR